MKPPNFSCVCGDLMHLVEFLSLCRTGLYHYFARPQFGGVSNTFSFARKSTNERV